MKKLTLLLLLLLAVSACTSADQPAIAQASAATQSGAGWNAHARDEREITVYVTRTGERYHRGSCQHLRRSKIPTSLYEAKRSGYTPCKVCRPAR